MEHACKPSVFEGLEVGQNLQCSTAWQLFQNNNNNIETPFLPPQRNFLLSTCPNMENVHGPGGLTSCESCL